jgi:hypothetical protein
MPSILFFQICAKNFTKKNTYKRSCSTSFFWCEILQKCENLKRIARDISYAIHYMYVLRKFLKKKSKTILPHFNLDFGLGANF